MITVLIVEDRPEISLIWKKHLKAKIGNQADIREARTLADGISLSKKIPPPDLILLDLGLTDSNPIQTIAQQHILKASNPNVVLITITGLVTPELAEMTIENGAHAVAHKLNIQCSSDLWDVIQSAVDKAPPNAQKAIVHTSEIIARLIKIVKDQ